MNQHAEEDHELGLFHVVCSWFNTVKYDNEKTLQLILYGKTYKSYLLSGNYIRKYKRRCYLFTIKKQDIIITHSYLGARILIMNKYTGLKF